MNNNYFHSDGSWRSQHQANTPTPSASITSPGQLLANIPGLLGFYPQESVVFVTLEKATKERPATHCGPVIRIDLEELHALSDIADIISTANIDYVIVFIVSEKCETEPEYFQQIKDLFLSAMQMKLLPIRWIWHTSAIFTGNSFRLVQEGASDHDDATPALWLNGTISSIATASTTQEMMTRGELPELSRQDCLDYFSGTTSSSTKELYEQAAVLLSETDALAKRLAEITTICRKIEAMKVMDSTAQQQQHIAVALCRTCLRDLLLPVLCAYPEAGKHLSLMVARSYLGVIRNNALCAYAMCELASTNSARTFHALIASHQDNPDHRLTSLLLTGYQAGVGKDILTAIQHGSYATYYQCGLLPPDDNGGGKSKVA